MKPKIKKIYLRFYEELNDLLPNEKRKIEFTHQYIDRASIKDVIESYGVPHTEIDLILAEGVSVGFEYIVEDGNHFSIYPEFESFDIAGLQRLRPEPLRYPKFVLDVHLGKLAKYMRMLGFDIFYKNNLLDEEIIEISLKEKRAVLTRDKGILKNKKITRGYFVRNTDGAKQLTEVTERFHLQNEIKEFTRCIECGETLHPIAKEKIVERLPANVKNFYDEFSYCKKCDKIYWRGSHAEKMQKVIEKIKSKKIL